MTLVEEKEKREMYLNECNMPPGKFILKTHGGNIQLEQPLTAAVGSCHKLVSLISRASCSPDGSLDHQGSVGVYTTTGMFDRNRL